MKLTRQRVLLISLLLGVIPRGVRLLFTHVVEGDGTEYCRLAERMLAGDGYLGMLPGTERMFPPGFPLLIMGVMKSFSVSSEVAARGLSMAFGLALPPLLALITARYASLRAALVTGVLAALLPGFVLSSAATYCESPQLTLFAGGLLFLMTSCEKRTLLSAGLAATLFAAAYLIRAESLATGLLAGLLLLSGPGLGLGLKNRLVPALTFFVVFFALCLPYPLFLSEITGEFRLEGKSERVIATVENFANDIPYLAANYGLSEHKADGPWLDPNEPWQGPTKAEILARSGRAILLRTARETVNTVGLYASGHSMGSLLFLLLLPFALRGPHPRGRLAVDLWFLGIAAYFVLATAFYKPVLRYLLPLGLMGVVWAGRAVDHLLTQRWNRPPQEGLGLLGWAMVAVLLISTGRALATGAREFGDAHEDHQAAKTLGEELRALSIPGRIMSDEVRIAFYAGGVWTPLPVAETEALFLARVAALDVGLIAVHAADGTPFERPGPWFDPENPPEPLVPVRVAGPYRVYRCR